MNCCFNCVNNKTWKKNPELNKYFAVNCLRCQLHNLIFPNQTKRFNEINKNLLAELLLKYHTAVC